jgi:ubiquinone/menaquinone biosynthesis C-methylase UbiE
MLNIRLARHERNDILKDLVLKDYSNDLTQRAYVEMTRKGLWLSERNLYKKYFARSFPNGKKMRIVDVGCGCGRVTIPLARMGHDSVGVDIAPGMIRHAKRLTAKMKISNGAVKFLVGDALRLPFKKGSFDGATFAFNGWNQIPGAENRQKALCEIHRVLRPGSFFIFSSGARGDLSIDFFLSMSYARSFLLEEGSRRIPMEYGDVFVRNGKIPHIKEGQYIHIPSVRTIVRQIRKAGFEIEFSGWKDEMWPKDARLGFGNCMMFVCRKPK